MVDIPDSVTVTEGRGWTNRKMNIDAYLDPRFHIYESLMARKRSGQIRHLGFSAHGNLDTMRRFLEAYGKDMEFCQIQLNWLDWDKISSTLSMLDRS